MSYAVRPQTMVSNEYYQKELCQCPRYCQLVAMSLLPGEQIPFTTEQNICKLVYVISGSGVIQVQKDENSKSRKHLMSGISVMVFPGSGYRIINNGNKHLKLLVNNTPPIQDFQNIKRPEPGSSAAVKQQPDRSKKNSVAKGPPQIRPTKKVTPKVSSTSKTKKFQPSTVQGKGRGRGRPPTTKKSRRRQ